MSVYTNVEACTHDSVSIPNVKSVSVTKTVAPIESRADGSRAGTVVGEMAATFAITVEAEDTAADLSAITGLANAGSFEFKTQLENSTTTLKTHTITNIVFLEDGISTDQENPGSVTLTGRNVGDDSLYSIT